MLLKLEYVCPDKYPPPNQMPFYPIKYWICYKFSAKNDSISSSNSWTKLPFPRNGVGNLKIHSHISGREFEAWNSRLGKPTPSKTDEFLEKFQTAFDPPPSFSESFVANFSNWLRSLQKLPEPYIFEKLGYESINKKLWHFLSAHSAPYHWLQSH